MKNKKIWMLGFCIIAFVAVACEDTELLSYNPVRNEVGGEPEPPVTTDYEVVFIDEFDSPSLDENKWKYRTGERMGGMNLPENVMMREGKMIQQMAYKNYQGKEWLTGGGIISHDMFGYGYYEIKCKLFTGTHGLHASFWSMGVGDGYNDGVRKPRKNAVFEIDGYEADSFKDHEFSCNLNSYIGGRIGLPGITKVDLTKEFVMAYEFLPTEVNWYIDGKKVLTRRTGIDIPIYYAQQEVWITALAWTAGGGAPDRNKLPAECSWEYFKFSTKLFKNINLLSNSDFEYNQNPGFSPDYTVDSQYPMCWMEPRGERYSYVEYNEHAQSGRNVLKHHHTSDYKTTTAQRIYNIANGTYELKASVMSSGGQNVAKIRISGYGGTTKEIDIPKADEMTDIYIRDVEVLKNGAYIEICSDAKAGQWVLVDNIEFYATEGEEVDPPLPNYMDCTEKTYGEIVASVKDKNAFTTTGSWEGSALGGYNGGYSQYSTKSGSTCTFKLTATKDKNYDIAFYRMNYQGNTKSAKVSWKYGDTTGERIMNLDTSGGKPQLVTLAKDVPLKAGDKVEITVSASDKGTIRVSAAVLMPEDALKMKEVVLFAIDKNRAVVKGKEMLIDENNKAFTPVMDNGTAMLPAKFIEEKLKVDLTYMGELISVEELKKQLPPQYKATFVPADLGKPHVLIGPVEYEVTEELKYTLFSLL